MPVRLSDMFRTVDCKIGNHVVSLKEPSIAVLRAIWTSVESLDDSEKGMQFANRLLAMMIVRPHMVFAQVAALTDDHISVLVDAAIDLLGASTGNGCLAEKLPPRERLLVAYQNQVEEMTRSVREITNTFANSFASLYSQQAADALTGIASAHGMQSDLKNSLQRFATIQADLMKYSFKSSLNLGNPIVTVRDALSTTSVSSMDWAALGAEIQSSVLAEPFISDALVVSGLNSSLIHTPSYVVPSILEMETEEDVDRRGDDLRRERLISAYDTVYLVETSLRDLVELRLRRLHGENWWKRGVPNEVRRSCVERKQQRESPDSLENALTSYLFIGELKDIIVKGDNWRDTFSEIFENERNSLDTMFLWIEPVRKDVAHPRNMSDVEYEQFTVAANWLVRRVQRGMI